MTSHTHGSSETRGHMKPNWFIAQNTAWMPRIDGFFRVTPEYRGNYQIKCERKFGSRPWVKGRSGQVKEVCCRGGWTTQSSVVTGTALKLVSSNISEVRVFEAQNSIYMRHRTKGQPAKSPTDLDLALQEKMTRWIFCVKFKMVSTRAPALVILDEICQFVWVLGHTYSRTKNVFSTSALNTQSVMCLLTEKGMRPEWSVSQLFIRQRRRLFIRGSAQNREPGDGGESVHLFTW